MASINSRKDSAKRRASARAEGLPTFQGVGTCKWGHENPLRLTSDGSCVACNKKKFADSQYKKDIAATQDSFEEARSSGALTYLAVRPCKAGHENPERYVSTQSCVLCDRERNLSAYHDNPEFFRERGKDWVKANRAHVNAYNMSRYAGFKKATPAWLSSEQQNEIVAFYEEARSLTKKTGIRHEVDHIVPLKGVYVSGLHVPWNLRVITKADNMAKGNSYDFVNQ